MTKLVLGCVAAIALAVGAVNADTGSQKYTAEVFEGRKGSGNKVPAGDWVRNDKELKRAIEATKRADSDQSIRSEWDWESAELYVNGRGKQLLWVYYNSPVRGKIWRWLELDPEKPDVIRESGWQEG